MSRIEWKDDLSVGVKEIDDQHKELIRIANGLIKAVSQGQEQQVLDKVINDLSEYTDFHFQSEEALMGKVQYIGRDDHIAEHARLRKTVNDYKQLLGSDTNPTSESILKFMKEWLLGHILTHDRDLAHFIHQQAAQHEIKWTDELSVGVPQIDDQHKELIRIVNGLIKAVSRGRDKVALDRILKKLREYTVFHFSSEEALMEEIRYPKRGDQAREHARLKTEVKAYQRMAYQKEDLTPQTILKFMSGWLLRHILDYDRELAKFIHENEAEETLTK